MNPPKKISTKTTTDLNKVVQVVPNELLVEEIFSRLSVESVGRCRCVCKSWHYLLTDPYFLKLHLSCNRDQPLKILQIFSSQSFRSIHIINEKQEYLMRDFDFPLKDPGIRVQSFIGSCNGLVCIHLILKREGHCSIRLALWNPTTRDYNILPDPPKPKISTYELLLGFYNDSSLDDYKVLRVVNNNHQLLWQANVYSLYSLRSNLWKLLPNAPHKLYTSSTRGFALNGYIYFQLDCCFENCYAGTIVAFSMKDDSFRELPLPPNRPHIFVHLTETGGHLAAFQLSPNAPTTQQHWSFNLWTFTDEEDNNVKGKHSWIKLMTISSLSYVVGGEVPSLRNPICFIHGKVLFLVFLDIHYETRFVLFDPKRQITILEDFLPRDFDNDAYSKGHITYTESLVSPNFIDKQ